MRYSKMDVKPIKRSRPSTESQANATSKAADGKPSPTKVAAKTVKNSQTASAKVESLEHQVFHWEEEQSETRDSGEDLKKFLSTCSGIREAVVQINDLKRKENSSKHPDVLEKRVEAAILTTNMKKLNRMAQMRGKKARENTQQVKQKVDSMHLELQNLLYEVMHMKGEIEQCLNFTSKDEEIDLVPIEEFYAEAPPEVSKPEITKDDPHQQMLARLDWELQQRKKLASEKEGIVKKKVVIEEEIKKKTDYLGSLKPRLDSIMKATLPVQDFMGMPIEMERIQCETAQFLPRPLYVLFVQAKAYRDACDKGMSVEIIGDIQEAKSFHSQENDEVQDSDDSDNEIDVPEEEENKRRKHKKEKERHRLEEQRKSLLRRHPLSIKIGIKCRDGFEISIQLYHIPKLHICTVNVSLDCSEEHQTPTVAASSLLSSSGILKDLMCSDAGLQSPDPTNYHLFQKLSMKDFSFYIGEIGIPYYWVQWICGLHYLPDQPIKTYVAESAVSYQHLQGVIKAIKARITTRLTLQKQLVQFEKLTIPPPERKSALSCFPAKIVSQLVSWKCITFEEFKELRFTEECIEMELVKENCAFYKAGIERDGLLDVAVVIYDSYPTYPPLFLVGSQEGKGKEYKQHELKCLECEVNAYAEELMKIDHPNMMLSNQMRRLQICFDMLVETSLNGAKEKLYTRKMRGRDRNRPYQFHKDGYFSHR